MFYSQLLLSKKGTLGTVWIAAHCHKRLKKDQIKQTDICSSVDKILVDEVPVVTYRILAYLLLGIVRIYSKKVEYLFHDCHDILNKLCDFKIGKRTRACIGVLRTRNHSITLPKRFELDAFDLELLEDGDTGGGNVISRENAVLSDGRRTEGSTWGLLYKENVSFSETYSTAHTPPRDVFSPHCMEHDLFMSPSCNINNSVASLEILRGTDFSLEDRLDPTVLDEAEKEQMHDMPSNENLRTNFQGPNHEMEFDSVAIPSHYRSDSVLSLEMLRGTRFSLDDRLDPLVLDEAEKEQINFRSSNEDLTNFKWRTHDIEYASVSSPSHNRSDLVISLEVRHGSGFSLEHCLDPLMLCEAEKGQGCDMPSDKEHGIEEEHVEHPRNGLNYQEDESHDFTRSIDIGQPVDAKKKKFVEVITPESRKFQRMQEQMKIISVDVTPDSKLPEDVGTPEVATVQTPAPKERAKILKKRKALLDNTTVLPNKILKNWIDDSNDLICKRRKLPHTLLHTWRANKFCHIPESFLDPLIPLNLGSIDFKKKSYIEPIEPVESSASESDVRSPVVLGVQEQTLVVTSPVTQRSHEQTLIAPGTPVMHLNSLRSHETETVADSDILESTSSLESVENWPSLSAGLELDPVFLDEEKNSYEGDGLEKNVYSARTGIAGRYLYRNFLNRKRQEEDEVLNLSQLLAGKAKKESARLFYEILVLKTGDCLDVRQDKAYDDILLHETSKLKQIAETDGG